MKVTKKIAQPGTTVVLFNVFTPRYASAARNLPRMRKLIHGCFSGGENSDARTKAMNELASQFPEGVETLTHVVTGKPDTAVLATAKHYVNCRLRVVLSEVRLTYRDVPAECRPDHPRTQEAQGYQEAHIKVHSASIVHLPGGS